MSVIDGRDRFAEARENQANRRDRVADAREARADARETRADRRDAEQDAREARADARETRADRRDAEQDAREVTQDARALADARRHAEQDARQTEQDERQADQDARERRLEASGAGSAHLDLLSDREREVLQLIAEGLSNETIAARLFLSPNTVKSIIRSAYHKAKVETRTQAVVWYLHGHPGDSTFSQTAPK